jgi:GTP-binding nuclear protein Ran
MTQPIPTFKCVIVGNGGVGKTTLVTKHLTGEFVQVYEPTLGVEVHPIVFNTTKGPIRFNIWDTAGQEKFSGLQDGYYVQADCAIVMFDLTGVLSYRDSKMWYDSVRNKCGNIPIIIVGSKVDIKDRKVMNNDIEFDREHDMYYDISSKSNYQFEKPFIELIKKLMSDDTIRLVD